MPFKHACFISYSHGKGDLIKRFVSELKSALTDYLDTYLDVDIYTDDRLVPGYHYNEALAQEICGSLCMIVVYIPKYERHEYCRREFAGMERLQETRFQLLGSGRDPKYGLIIPVILEGIESLPPQIKAGRHYGDFSAFSPTKPELKRIPEFEPALRKIARYINALYTEFERFGDQVCDGCDRFQLPNPAPPWRELTASLPTELPLRSPEDALAILPVTDTIGSPFPWTVEAV